MPKVVALKEIRHDEQRFNLEDVCAFLLARDLVNLSDRMAKLAREHALETLKTVFERKPLQKFKAPGALRATNWHYIQDPIELTNIVEELSIASLPQCLQQAWEELQAVCQAMAPSHRVPPSVPGYMAPHVDRCLLCHAKHVTPS